MNDEMEEAIDVLLRGRFEGPIPDDGFCQSVMDRLPARRHRISWPLVVGTLAGAAMCWFSLWSSPIPYIGWMSGSAIALFISMISMPILALAWTIAEADDRYDPSSQRSLR